MAVIARDQVARDHLVYAWPLPIGPEGCEVSCGDDEQVVMCPAWMVGDRLGPGRHHWRTPDPTRPVAAFFVSTTPVSATFDMSTAFMIPNTRMPVRIRATGALEVRCADAGLLIAQFVGLPFDTVNEGILRSVSRSIERMLARLLTRRVVMAGTPAVVTDPVMLPHIVEELVAYNPTAGAVFGIELMAVAHLVIGADDGSTPFVMLPNLPVPTMDGTWREPSDQPHVNGEQQPPMAASSNPDISMTDTAPGRPKSPTIQGHQSAGEIRSGEIRSGEIGAKKTERHASVPPADAAEPSVTKTLPGGSTGAARDSSRDSSSNQALAGEIVVRPKEPVPEPPVTPPIGTQPPVEHPRSHDEITQPGVGKPTPLPGTLKAPDVPKPAEEAAPKPRSSAPSIPPPIPAAALRSTPPPGSMQAPPPSGPAAGAKLPPLQPAHTPIATPPPVSKADPAVAPVSKAEPAGSPEVSKAEPAGDTASLSPGVSKADVAAVSASAAPAVESRGSILGIGMSSIGSTNVGSVAGEIPTKVPPGGRVLVPGPNGLMQSATVRQLLQGYYELEVGSSGETIWVPINNVVPES